MGHGIEEEATKLHAGVQSEVVQLARTSSKTSGQIARELDLTETAVRAWIKQAEVDAGGGGSGALTTSEREELAALKREVKTLRMEREVLKKASADYQNALKDRGVTCSMSRKGNCWDAVAESFFATLKLELIYPRRFATRREAKDAIFDYVEVFYNRRRRHSTLSYLSPVDFELNFLEEKMSADYNKAA